MTSRGLEPCPFCGRPRILGALASLVIWPNLALAAPDGLPHALRLRICRGCAEAWCHLIEQGQDLRHEVPMQGGRPVPIARRPARKVG